MSKPVYKWSVLLNVILTLVTGGLWLVVLLLSWLKNH